VTHGKTTQKRPRAGPSRSPSPVKRSLYLAVTGLLLITGTAVSSVAHADEAAVVGEIQSLDGRGNNRAHADWGRANTPYTRVAPARYADGRSQPFDGPNSRRVSNRVFNDVHQNVFSERQVTQWGFVWGQWIDHNIGLRLGRDPGDPQGETANIAFDPADPLEEFRNDLGVVPFVRSTPAPGTGVTNARQQVNVVGSYIDASTVYGDDLARLEWLREGPVDGNMANNSARLLLPGQYLPAAESRGNAATAPGMAVDGRLRARPARAKVAGDVRANENIGLTATHTLFAREHNRIVGLLPASLSEEEKFQIARRVVIAEIQFITYSEFLPAVGVNLPAYGGYNPNVNANLGNEFATVAYRAHSMIHGEFELESEVARYTPAQLDAFRRAGIEVKIDGDELELAIPLNVAFFNPDLLTQVQLGPMLHALGGEAEYKNDDMIDNQLRSVLFQVPVSGNPECLDGQGLPECFDGVLDLAAIDIERGRDHGMPTYNDLRAAFGLPRKTSFRAITGEASENFPADPALTPGKEIDDPQSLDFVDLRDLFGQKLVSLSDEAQAASTNAVRRAPLAARLKALYGSVDNLDAFTGVFAEAHSLGSDFGELQRAVWAQQFRALRDGDRFFYGNDPALAQIRSQFGIDFRRNLGDVIASNTDVPRAEMSPNVFFVGGQIPVTSCRVTYAVSQWTNEFQADLTITNSGSTPIDGWNLRFAFPDGQVIRQVWNGLVTQDGVRVPLTNEHWNPVLNPGQTLGGVGFIASWNNRRNGRPTSITLNTTPCSVG
jgi:hypothetical protein